PGAHETVAKVLIDGQWRLVLLGVDGTVRDLVPQAHHALELQAPTWNADGSLIAYQVEAPDGIHYEGHIANAEGTSDQVVRRPTQSAWNTAWSPARNQLVYFVQEPAGGFRLDTVRVEPRSQPVAISSTFDVGNVGWSPDGRWVIAQFDADP